MSVSFYSHVKEVDYQFPNTLVIEKHLLFTAFHFPGGTKTRNAGQPDRLNFFRG